MLFIKELSVFIALAIPATGVNAALTINNSRINPEYIELVDRCMGKWADSHKNDGTLRPYSLQNQGDRYLIMYTAQLNVRSPYGHWETKLVNDGKYICNLDAKDLDYVNSVEAKIAAKEQAEKDQKTRIKKQVAATDWATDCVAQFKPKFKEHLRSIGQPKDLENIEVVAKDESNGLKLLVRATAGYGIVAANYMQVLTCNSDGSLAGFKDMPK